MDYKQLLIDYMAYVIDVEGSDFVGGGEELEWRREAESFSAQEQKALARVSILARKKMGLD